MLVWARRLVLVVICAVLVGMSAISVSVTASPVLCSASVSPTFLTPSSTNTLELEINNDGSTVVDYIYVTSPSEAVSILDMTAAGWGAQGGGTSMSLQYGALAVGDSLVVSILVETGLDETSAANWNVEVSDDGGNTLSGCNGALDLTISNTPPSSIPPVISGITLTNLTASGVTVIWTTDEGSTSQVVYGKTTSYDMATTVSSELTTAHSVILHSLEADTGYHFQVISTDASNNTSYSSDNTFLTPFSLNENQSTTLNSRSAIKKQPTESVAPVLDFSVTFEKAYKTPPTFRGIATDNDAVAVTEYTTDGGLNWLPTTVTTGLGSKKVNFEITPSHLMDGDYKFVVRILDASGNSTVSSQQILVIDKLPPVIGGVTVKQGNQTAVPNREGELVAQIGVDQVIILSAVGGPTDITLNANSKGAKKITQTFSMSQSPQTGLWKGLISFSQPGTYTISAKALDGAQNTTERVLSTVKVIAPGSVKNSKGDSIVSEIKVYARNQETNSWELWDAESYLQSNPKTASEKEGVSFYLPTGFYYLKVSSPGYQSTVTVRFEVKSPTYINPSFVLKRSFGVTILRHNIRLPWVNYKKDVVPSTSDAYAYLKGMNEHTLSQFALPLTNGKTLKTADLYGKPTVLTFVNTWTAQSSAQLATFGELDSKTINVLPIGAGESLARLNTYALLGNYKTPILVDGSNTLADELGLGTLPVTYFLDRHGVVKKTVVGIMSRDEIVKNITL